MKYRVMMESGINITENLSMVQSRINNAMKSRPMVKKLIKLLKNH